MSETATESACAPLWEQVAQSPANQRLKRVEALVDEARDEIHAWLEEGHGEDCDCLFCRETKYRDGNGDPIDLQCYAIGRDLSNVSSDLANATRDTLAEHRENLEAIKRRHSEADEPATAE